MKSDGQADGYADHGGVYLKAIPWELIEPHDDQAQRNHHQTLERLAERGGLGPSEAVVIIQDRQWRRLDELSCERALMRMIVAHHIAMVAAK